MAADQPTLFDIAPYWVVPAVEPGERVSSGRRRTIRQHRDIAAGRHPLTGGPLHPDAAPAEPADAAGRRCGNCRFRRATNWGTARSYPKCWYGHDGDLSHPPPRYSHSEATDVRAFWPACADHEYPPEEGATS